MHEKEEEEERKRLPKKEERPGELKKCRTLPPFSGAGASLWKNGRARVNEVMKQQGQRRAR